MIRLAMVLAILATSASAQVRHCGPRETVIAHMATKYSETRQAVMLSADGALVELLASIASGSWTIIYVRPGGLTCVLAFGQGFEVLAEALPPEGDDL